MRGEFLSPLRGLTMFRCKFPTACAVGYTLAPFQGLLSIDQVGPFVLRSEGGGRGVVNDHAPVVADETEDVGGLCCCGDEALFGHHRDDLGATDPCDLARDGDALVA